PSVDGEPYQHILPVEDTGFELTTVDLGSAGDAGAIEKAVQHTFRLDSEVPLHACLFADGETDVLILVVHHIAGDGWSMGPLARDLSVAY
ncbi:hypothetical protein H0H10_03375, partial [Streptomyces sp. TRM S81-3]